MVLPCSPTLHHRPRQRYSERLLGVLGDGWTGNHPMSPSGPASSSLNQLKVYTKYFEEDADDIADIDLYIKDRDCGSGTTTLKSDTSRDTKRMAKLGTEARREDICIRNVATYVPTGTSRRVHVFAYCPQQHRPW